MEPTIYHSTAIESNDENREHDVYAKGLITEQVEQAVTDAGGHVYVSRGFQAALPRLVMVLPPTHKPEEFLPTVTWTASPTEQPVTVEISDGPTNA